MGEHPEDAVTTLQERVRQRLAELRPLDPADDAHAAAVDAVIEAATELVDYEEQLPVLLDRAPRRLSLQVVRWSGVVTAALGTSLAVAAVAGWTSRWSVLLALVACAAAVVPLRAPVPPPTGSHLALRPGAVAVAAGAAVITVATVARLPLAVAGVGVAVVVAGLWHLRRGRAW